MDLNWIKQHKYVVGLFGAAVIGYVLYSYIQNKNSSAGTASPVTGGNAVQSGSPQYLVPVIQSGVAPTAAPLTPAPNTTPANGNNSATVINPNPYPVGTSVTSSESIVQSAYDPLYNGWVDLTSKGGIYTSPGFGVSGSAYSPQWSGNGRLAVSSSGTQVMEYTPTGSLAGTYALGT